MTETAKAEKPKETAVRNNTGTAVFLCGQLLKPGETLVPPEKLALLKKDQGFLRRLRLGNLSCDAVRLQDPEALVIARIALCDSIADLKPFAEDKRPAVKAAVEGCHAVLTHPQRVPKIRDCKTAEALLDIWTGSTGMHSAEVRAAQKRARELGITLPKLEDPEDNGIVPLW